MRAPLSWLREYVTVDATAEEIAHRLAISSVEVERVVDVGVADVEGNLGCFLVGRVLEVLEERLLGGGQDLDPDVLPEVDALDGPAQRSPGRLELLHVWAVQDLVHLRAEALVELGDHPVHGVAVDLLRGLGGREHLHDEGGHAPLRDVVALVGGLDPRLGEDLVEERAPLGGLRLSLLFGLGLGHLFPPPIP